MMIKISCFIALLLITSSHYFSHEKLPKAFENIGITEKINTQAIINIPVQSENGDIKALNQYLDPNKPIILTFAYYRCPMLCQLLLNGIRDSVLSSKRLFLGKDYQLVTVSMAKEDRLADLSKFREQYTRDLSPFGKKNWHFFITDEKNRRLLTNSVGYAYKYVEESDDYAHQSALIFLDAKGIIKRYVYGILFNEDTLQKAFLESKDNKNLFEKTLMFCYLYDSERNSYVIHAKNVMKIVGFLTVLLLGGLLFKLFYDEHQKKSVV